MNAVQAKQKNPTASPSGKQQDRKKKIRKLLSRIYNARDLYLIILIPFISVSYTHLDVYKRQLFQSTK